MAVFLQLAGGNAKLQLWKNSHPPVRFSATQPFGMSEKVFRYCCPRRALTPGETSTNRISDISHCIFSTGQITGIASAECAGESGSRREKQQ